MPSLVKISPVVLKNRILKCCKCVFAILQIHVSQPGKSKATLFQENEILYIRILCIKFS